MTLKKTQGCVPSLPGPVLLSRALPSAQPQPPGPPHPLPPLPLPLLPERARAKRGPPQVRGHVRPRQGQQQEGGTEEDTHGWEEIGGGTDRAATDDSRTVLKHN